MLGNQERDQQVRTSIKPGVREVWEYLVHQYHQESLSDTGGGGEVTFNQSLAWTGPSLQEMLRLQKDQLLRHIFEEMTRSIWAHHEQKGLTAEYGHMSGQIKKLFSKVLESVHQYFGDTSANERKKQAKGHTPSRQNTFETDPKFALAVYQELVPEILALSSIGEKRNPESGNTSFEEYADVIATIMKAKETGTLYIFSQMCAQYQSGQEHSAASFTNGLAQEFSQEKIDRAFAIHKKIADVLNRFGVKVHIVSPQVDAHPASIPALVPATFWEYAKQGKLAEMLRTLDEHTVLVSSMIRNAVGTHPGREVMSESLSRSFSNEKGVAQLALEYMQLFIQFCNAYLEKKGHLEGDNSQRIQEWYQIPSDVLYKAVVSPLRSSDSNNTSSYDEYQEIVGSLSWTPQQRVMFRKMVEVLAEPKWGTYADTTKFYERYNGITPPAVDQAQLVSQLYAAGYTQELAAQIAQSASNMNKIEIGSRAIYNTCLYFAMGQKLAELNTPHSAAVMIPVEEDKDRWGVKAIDEGYQYHRMYDPTPGRAGTQSAPVVYPRKTLRQPFGITQ